jgi:hypothetical protein
MLEENRSVWGGPVMPFSTSHLQDREYGFSERKPTAPQFRFGPLRVQAALLDQVQRQSK